MITLHRCKDEALTLIVYPVEQEPRRWDPDVTVPLEIRGNLGPAMWRIHGEIPKPPRRAVLQDLPRAIGMALSAPDEEILTHGMSKPLAIKGIIHVLPRSYSYGFPDTHRRSYQAPLTKMAGANFYYLRSSSTNWPDHKCHEILETNHGSHGCGFGHPARRNALVITSMPPRTPGRGSEPPVTRNMTTYKIYRVQIIPRVHRANGVVH